MAEKEWYLEKAADHEVYGPVSLGELKTWAVAAKVSPMDRVSSDGKVSWMRAPMVAELQMDWLIELEGDYLYGPTSLATIQEFIESGEIGADDIIINCTNNERMTVCKCPTFTNLFAGPLETEEGETQVDAVIQVKHLENQISRLEGLVETLRSQLTESEQLCQQLKAKLQDQDG